MTTTTPPTDGDTPDQPDVDDAEIDPRLRERRAEVARDAGRRRLRRVAVLVGLIGIVAAGWAIAQSALFDVDRLTVHGLDRVSLSEVERTIAIPDGASMFFIDEGAMQERLEEIPWVESADVRLDWPGTVVVDVVERTPAAIALANPDEWVLVDLAGRVLSDPLPAPPPLPRLSGLRAAGQPGDFLADDASAPLAVVGALELALGHADVDLALGEAVRGVYRDSRGELRVLLGASRLAPGGGEFIVGDDDALRAKVAAMRTMLDIMAEQGRSGWLIDVSIANMPVVVDPDMESARSDLARSIVPADLLEPHDDGTNADGEGVLAGSGPVRYRPRIRSDQGKLST